MGSGTASSMLSSPDNTIITFWPLHLGSSIMKPIIPSVSESSGPMKSYERFIVQSGSTVETTSQTRCQVYSFEAYIPSQAVPPPNYSSISKLEAEWEQENEGQSIKEGRQWVADTFYSEDGDTVRTMRLRKGWSQAHLAEKLGTSQSHIARIEKGTENLHIETCRKLALALGVDLNTLNQALERQEAITRKRVLSK